MKTRIFSIYMDSIETELPEYNINMTPALEIISDIAKVEKINKKPQETLLFVGFDAWGKICGISQLSIGNDKGMISSIKNIMQAALLCNADCFAVLHNHPSGTANPSNQDKEACRQLIDAALLMDMELIEDAVIDFDGNAASTLNLILLDRK